MLTKLYCEINDFCKNFIKEWHKELIGNFDCQMGICEIMTIVVQFHLSNMRTFKHFYQILEKYHKREFPTLLSYNRFVEMMPITILPLMVFLKQCKMGTNTGISFIDSTKLRVCHNKRINSNKVFKDIAKRGKDSTGWYYGFKLHLVINEHGEIINFTFSPANVDDRKPVQELLKNLKGKVYADKGYISEELAKALKNVQLIARPRKNMKKEIFDFDKIMLRKRAIIETVNDQLKNICQLEHSRHRSPINFIVNAISSLVAYSFKEKKPSIFFNQKDIKQNNPITI